MDDNIKVLNEIHQGLVIGLDSISSVSTNVSDNDFRKVLKSQYEEYNTILNKVNSEFAKHGENPKDVKSGEKIKSYMNTKISTLKDKSTSNISDVLIKGNLIGVVTGRRLLNENKNISFEVKSILKDFIIKQENDIEKLKEWL